MAVYWVEDHYKKGDRIKEFLLQNPAVRFVSLVGVDFLGNDTDERIPVDVFLKNREEIYTGGIQTDGSSVSLEGIASLNDGKVDFVIDFQGRWIVDANPDLLWEGQPVSTLRIPIFFRHRGKLVCSRSVMRETQNHLRRTLLPLLVQDKSFLKALKVRETEIDDLYFTLGTELEFWVRTPAARVSSEDLSLSQTLKESYWKRVKGEVRSGLEEVLLLLGRYGLEPEMGHKEVGGVKARMTKGGALDDVMEQLEIDWHFADPLTTADNDILARSLVREVFRKRGLEATFSAKPVEGVAGSGKHCHVGMGLLLKSGRKINLLAPVGKESFLSSWGYGALMGLLKNWSDINPFVTHSLTALKRLKPGFEAPICPVASLGRDPTSPSRNRTVLIGVVRSADPLSLRFEVRAPNPHTNTYLAVSAFFLAMAEGIRYSNGHHEESLHKELTKAWGEPSPYLRQDREYCTDKDIFTDFPLGDRERLFGRPPTTVWEILEPLRALENSESEVPSLYRNTPMDKTILLSFKSTVLNKWFREVGEKVVPEIRSSLAHMERSQRENSLDKERWREIEEAREEIVHSDKGHPSLLESLENAVSQRDGESVSSLSRRLEERVDRVWELYRLYRANFWEEKR